ncbi:ABC transporter permease [Actinoallomurus bryophytorum]|uniref:ABC-2 family transporter n=1 Tax=Actinoallomurus bryophytorum TaxID=1490222 RepID=A0A543CRF1_9ACTN|nr:ABC transporter permease subunit [Actinoallomurus bryophytorum]TQL99664.1 ABC-2 family transporter [Actinoallomurus bryophytorum]
MIWLTWRQHRAQAFVGAVLVALTAVVFLSYGQSMRGAYTQDGIGGCLAHGTGGDHCQSVLTVFMGRFNGVTNHLLTWFSPLPGLIGAIVGASLLGREYEQGTWRLAWTQAVPRTRWLTAKLSLVGFGILVTTMALSAIFAWFRSPMDQVSGRFAPGAFDLEGLSLTGYTLFAFALGVLAGLLLRRTVPAIVSAFAAFLAVRLPAEYWLRQRYQSPAIRLLDPAGDHTMGPGSIPTSSGPRSWVLSQDLVDRTGHAISSAQQEEIARKLGTFSNPAASDAYLRGLGLRLRVVYQPAGRFWHFQIIEASLFVGLAAALLAIAIWRLHRRGD